MFGIGMTELLMILGIGLLVLGPRRLPELAGSLGKGLVEFRHAAREARREFSAAHRGPEVAAGDSEAPESPPPARPQRR